MKHARFAFILAALFTAGCSEEPEVRYADWDEANAEGAMTRGWLPEWLPRSAENIRERHNIDTNQSAFSFVAVEGWKAPMRCRPAVDPPNLVVYPRGFLESAAAKSGVLRCDDLYVLADKDVVYGWR